MTLESLRAKRSTILDIAARHGGQNVRVFRSVIRGEAAEGSDVDLLIRLDENRRLFDLIRFKHDLEDLEPIPITLPVEAR